MFALPRHWRSIDRKLPLLASGLVVLTAIVLGATAYHMLGRALLDATGQRLAVNATIVAEMVTRPTARVQDMSAAGGRPLLAFARGDGSRSAALEALGRPSTPTDTTRIFAAILDTAGRVLLAYQRPPAREPQWATDAIRRRAVRTDTTTVGPIEDVGGNPAASFLVPLRDDANRHVGYVAETRLIVGRGVSQIRDVVGAEVELIIGDPTGGVWTDLTNIVPGPPVRITGPGVIAYDGGIGAVAPVAGASWVIWLSQPDSAVLVPAKRLLWSMVPLGLLIALVGAAAMWRMARHITRPLAELTEVAEGVARDTQAMPRTDEMPVAVRRDRRGDEIARLRYAFERMGKRLAEQKALETQLRQAQKMEAIGRLAGGVAHDFNNLLTAIRSYADLVLEDMPAYDTKRSDVQQIRIAAERAAGLTAQLLAFSRKSMMHPKVLDTRLVLTEVEGMLRRLVPEDIALKVETRPGLWPVKADRGQLEQVIVNLAVNARDAMPQGGTLTISAVNEQVNDRVDLRASDVQPGFYVVIRVSDTGHGMDALTQSRVFEPFFTTKAVGQGTGLGLATVHGIIAQSGGEIAVDSEPGRGTTFSVYLPRAYEAPALEQNAVPRASTHRAGDTVLLVEDEQAVRALARRVLAKSGFRVLEATSPSDALRLASEHSGEIRLVLSDVVMPEMSGPRLVEKIADICPRARVLFISGYTDEEVIGRGLADPGSMLLQKPFSAQQLVDRVRSAIDAA